MAELICLKTYDTRPEAELAAGLLKENGIKSQVISESGALSHISLFNGPSKLFVNAADEEQAREILDEESE